MRRGVFNTMLYGKRLFQQYVVDMYIKVESSRLDYIKNTRNKYVLIYTKVLLIAFKLGKTVRMLWANGLYFLHHLLGEEEIGDEDTLMPWPWCKSMGSQIFF